MPLNIRRKPDVTPESEEERLRELLDEIQEIRSELRKAQKMRSHEGFSSLAQQQRRLVELLKEAHPNLSRTAQDLYS